VGMSPELEQKGYLGESTIIRMEQYTTVAVMLVHGTTQRHVELAFITVASSALWDLTHVLNSPTLPYKASISEWQVLSVTCALLEAAGSIPHLTR
jgi:hypothetical protein